MQEPTRPHPTRQRLSKVMKADANFVQNGQGDASAKKAAPAAAAHDPFAMLDFIDAFTTEVGEALEHPLTEEERVAIEEALEP